MKYSITFAYGNSMDCLADVELVERHVNWANVSYADLAQYTIDINNINFYTEIIETDDNKNLTMLIEETRLALFKQDGLPDWIQLVGITPIINSEIEDVINNDNIMHLSLIDPHERRKYERMING